MCKSRCSFYKLRPCPSGAYCFHLLFLSSSRWPSDFECMHDVLWKLTPALVGLTPFIGRHEFGASLTFFPSCFYCSNCHLQCGHAGAGVFHEPSEAAAFTADQAVASIMHGQHDDLDEEGGANTGARASEATYQAAVAFLAGLAAQPKPQPKLQAVPQAEPLPKTQLKGQPALHVTCVLAVCIRAAPHFQCWCIA